MKPNLFTKRFLALGRWMATTLLCISVIAFMLQGSFFSNTTAMAAPADNLIAATDIGDRVQEKTSEDAGRAKGFIRDTADRVERTANKNAKRVEKATDSNGSFVERKAKRDRDTIEKRAEEDASRTQKAVDNTKNVVKRAVDNVKDALSD